MHEQIGTLVILNQVDEFNKIPIWLEEMQKKAQFSDRLNFKLDLVLGEAIPNIMSYGYTDEAMHEIKIHLYQSESHFLLEILDDGIEFNPLSKKEYQAASSLESATINGRGIHLIKSFSDQQLYERQDGFNKLSIYFNKKNAENLPDV